MDLTSLLLSPLGILLLGYAAVAALLTIAAHPLRVLLVQRVEEMLAEPKWDEHEREELNFVLDTCAAFRVGPIVVIVFLEMILRAIVGVEHKRENERLLDDDRFGRIVALYLLSVGAANPVAAIVAIPLVMILVVVSALFARDHVKVIAEESAVRVAHSASTRLRVA
jgi:hypothetical protein